MRKLSAGLVHPSRDFARRLRRGSPVGAFIVLEPGAATDPRRHDGHPCGDDVGEMNDEPEARLRDAAYFNVRRRYIKWNRRGRYLASSIVDQKFTQS